jgi:putative ABC transport system permease protein
VAVVEIGRDGARVDGTFGMYSELKQRARSFEVISAFKPWQPTMTGEEQPERFSGQRVTASYFRALGVSPLLGRDFTAEDDRPAALEVVILSDRLWRRRFNADRTIPGRDVVLDGRAVRVIGVMPPSFENVLAQSAELWAPLQYDIAEGRAWGHHLRAVARLRPGVTTTSATREVNAIGSAVLAELRPETYGAAVQLHTPSLHDEVTRGVEPALLVILAAVLLVLIIACVNVTNMLLARGVRRRDEFALRAALGAGRRRLIQQLLTESLLLAAVGGLAGMAVAALGIRAFVTLAPPGLPRVEAIRFDPAVFAFGLALTTVVGLVFGLMPAMQASRSELQPALQRASPRTAGGQRRVRSALVAAEVAIALVLLVASGLLLRSLHRLFAVERGFDAARMLTMQIHTSGERFTRDSATYRFFAEALDKVRSLPGVATAALTSQLPLSGDADLYGVHFDPKPAGDAGEVQGTFRYGVSPGYVEAMGIPLRRGRSLTTYDVAGAPLAVLISESMAGRRLPGVDPIGKQLRIGPADGPLYTIVGVVGDVRQVSLSLNAADAVYMTAAQWRFADNTMSLVVRARDDAAALTAAVRQAVWSVDRDQPIVRVATMDDLLADSTSEVRFALLVFEAFAIAALVLAAAGIYGVISGSVAERTREIGVRSALGASRGDILTLVVNQGLVLTVIGVTIGLALAVGTSRVMGALLFGVSPLDAVTYVVVIALLFAVSVVASAVPAWRAARIDPVTTLRAG